jgi:hypothetical protein
MALDVPTSLHRLSTIMENGIASFVVRFIEQQDLANTLDVYLFGSF